MTGRWLGWLLAPALAGAQGLPERVRLCESCHGAGGNSTVAKTPSIAAQPVTYLENQIVYFREGLRPAPVMQAVAKDMKDDVITALAKHFAAQKAVVGAASGNSAGSVKGKALAEKMHCGQCHLPEFQGRDQMPRLAAQREDYLLESMIGYRDGKRTGADTTMTEVLYGVADEDLKALAEYLARLELQQ